MTVERELNLRGVARFGRELGGTTHRNKRHALVADVVEEKRRGERGEGAG